MWIAALAMVLMVARPRATDLAWDPTVLQESWNLLALGGYGHSAYEHGAFIVRDDRGQLRLSVWRFDRELRSAHFSGPIPPGVVAITHTHPNPLPMPSDDDMLLARRTGLPVYVLTRMIITATDGRRTRVVVGRDWRPVQSGDQVTGGCDTTAAK